MGKCEPTIVANCVVSMIVLCCGIAFSALYGYLLKLTVKDVAKDVGLQISGSELDHAVAHSTTPWWAFGFAFMVPGLLGAIGTCTRIKGTYITHMIFCIITLFVMGGFFLVSLVTLNFLAVANPDDNCHDVNNICHCKHLDVSAFNYTCEDSRKMYTMRVSIMITVVLGWIFTLVNAILSGILTCRHETTPGVDHRTQTMTTVVQLAPVAHPVKTHDQAQLVHNIEH